MLILIAVYTYDCFAALGKKVSGSTADWYFHKQTTLMFFFLINADFVIFLNDPQKKTLVFFAAEVVFFLICMLIYKRLYQNASKSLVNNMCMLLCIGFIILSRLKPDTAIRQLALATAALLLSCLIPLMIEKLHLWNKLSWLYAAVGIVGLLMVFVFSTPEYGAKLSISVGSFKLQPSEFIKILFVFFVAAMLYQSTEFKQILTTAVIAAIHVGILAACKDLGAAMIYYITFVVMVYVASQKPVYLLLGGGIGALACVAGYFLFSHVRVRVLAWSDPLSYVNNEGYQVSQSLFAIGTGGWFGSGLYEGMPEKIPVVTTDFVFSAISEEMGGLTALCIIFIIISCFLMMFNIAMQIRDPFYKLIALGLGCLYAVQCLTTLGGVTKFIPSTGVTLPLISYGGSSILSTMIIFAIIQGLYLKRTDEGIPGRRQAPV